MCQGSGCVQQNPQNACSLPAAAHQDVAGVTELCPLVNVPRTYCTYICPACTAHLCRSKLYHDELLGRAKEEAYRAEKKVGAVLLYCCCVVAAPPCMCSLCLHLMGMPPELHCRPPRPALVT
jgi:hypothetical protein